MSKHDFDKVKADIMRKQLKEMSSGKMTMPKQSERQEKVFPDKAYDPHKMFRQKMMENGDKIAQTEDDVVEQEKTFPDKQQGDRFKELRKYLNSMNMKK